MGGAGADDEGGAGGYPPSMQATLVAANSGYAASRDSISSAAHPV
jgi:hypothetical protein